MKRARCTPLFLSECSQASQTPASEAPIKKVKRSCFTVTSKEIRAFFALLEEEYVREFLEMDKCMRISDKYLLAMVFAYFKRADFTIRNYTRTNFFVALYLANDVEEDEEELKYEIFPWALGERWKEKYTEFLKKRDALLQRIDYKAIVSKRCCDEIMAIEPSHSAWKRERPEHHAGAIRAYSKNSQEDGYPRGPWSSPLPCAQCDKESTDSQYDSASPTSCSWYISSDDSPDTTVNMETNIKTASSRFDMKGLQQNLPNNDEIWPTIDE